MLTKRIIACLDIKNGEVVKGIKFESLKSVGNAVELAIKYENDGIDELTFLDITATNEHRKTLISLVKDIAKNLRIPFTVGGGIKTIQDIEDLLEAGADKVSLNSTIVRNPEIISHAAKQFGSQAIVAAIDSKIINSTNKVFINAGKIETELVTEEWAKKVYDLGAGEILLTSMDHDGTKNGYPLELLKKISELVPLPLIASGGAGNMVHFLEAFSYANVDACLAASLFHYNEIQINELKKFLKLNNIEVRL
ncbi:MAG TPA: imidazole glycerol phosphate synthase subunit HisF [Ignavibacteriales bacterium]|nr:imidazole glycerol phosphate synthase subunit HisF [Ignavibacteriales bacterium]